MTKPTEDWEDVLIRIFIICGLGLGVVAAAMLFFACVGLSAGPR